MNDLIDFLTANSTLAYITAFVIFIITVILLVKRLIGFMVSLLLLAFALLSGLAIANHDLFREILTSFKTDPAASNDQKYEHFKDQLSKAYDELKVEFEQQKAKMEKMIDAYKNSPKSDEVKK